jgi:hypothetical protein
MPLLAAASTNAAASDSMIVSSFWSRLTDMATASARKAACSLPCLPAPRRRDAVCRFA